MFWLLRCRRWLGFSLFLTTLRCLFRNVLPIKLLEDKEVFDIDSHVGTRQESIHSRVQALKQTDESLDAGRLGLLLRLLLLLRVQLVQVK